VNGHGVTRDDQQAVAWFRKAADQGFAIAEWALGSAYENAAGGPQDLLQIMGCVTKAACYQQAIDYYRKPTEQGLTEATRKLNKLECPNPHPNDVVAQVLNYTVFGYDEGFAESFWHKDPSGTCRYRLHIPSNELDLAQNQRDFIDLDEFDPRNITFRSDSKSGTFVMSDIEILFSNVRGLNLDRLQRGWGLIDSNYCHGKEKPF
jgi:hypothetical protein